MKKHPSHPTVGLHDYIETNYALEGINWYNKECRKILDIAINAGNKTLALKALSFFVQDMIIYEGGHDAKSPDGTWKRKGNTDTVYFKGFNGNKCYITSGLHAMLEYVVSYPEKRC